MTEIMPVPLLAAHPRECSPYLSFKPFNFHHKIYCIPITGFSIILLVQIVLNSLKLNAGRTFFSDTGFKLFQKKCSKPFVLMFVCNDDFLQGITNNIIVLLEVPHHKTNSIIFIITYY